MLFLILALAGLLFVSPEVHRDGGTFGGTFIGAVVAQDGIVVGSDSRSTFVNGGGKRIGYVDGMPKIFVDHGAAVAVAGLTSVEDELFSSFMRRNDYILKSPVNEILFDVALKLPFRNTTNVLLLSAGYGRKGPTVCAKAPVEPQSCIESGFIANKISPSLRRWQETHGRATTAEAAVALNNAIREAADLDSTIGGPITLLVVSKSGAVQWLQNPPNDHGWTRVCDVVDAYRHDRMPIFFTDSKEGLDRYLGEVCPKQSPRL